MSVVYGVKTT